MPIITVQSIAPVTELYREVVVEDRFYRRTNESLATSLTFSDTELTDAELIAEAIATGKMQERSEYRVLNRAICYDFETPKYVGQGHGFDRELEETVNVVTLKIPLNRPGEEVEGRLPANYDSLPLAEQQALAIEWGRNIARTVNFADY